MLVWHETGCCLVRRLISAASLALSAADLTACRASGIVSALVLLRLQIHSVLPCSAPWKAAVLRDISERNEAWQEEGGRTHVEVRGEQGARAWRMATASRQGCSSSSTAREHRKRERESEPIRPLVRPRFNLRADAARRRYRSAGPGIQLRNETGEAALRRELAERTGGARTVRGRARAQEARARAHLSRSDSETQNQGLVGRPAFTASSAGPCPVLRQALVRKRSERDEVEIDLPKLRRACDGGESS